METCDGNGNPEALVATTSTSAEGKEPPNTKGAERSTPPRWVRKGLYYDGPHEDIPAGAIGSRTPVLQPQEV